MSSGSTQLAFQLQIDPLTGNSEWIVIDDQYPDEAENEIPDDKARVLTGSQQPLLATTSYLDMLNDSPRNKAFRDAIDRTITKPSHVLDIGGGTGLLAMMAARAMGCSVGDRKLGSTVTCCESYLPMVKLMRRVLRVNGLQHCVNVINKRSDELVVGVDMASRANVLVSEILDSELLGEGLIPTLQHAHDALLVENPQTVPYRATTYGQLVESEFLSRLHDLRGKKTSALDEFCLVPSGFDNIVGVKPKQYAFQCNAIEKEIKLLSEPFKIFEFDFWKRPESYGETHLPIKAIDNGRVHAIISWWVLQLDGEGTIFYSTAPRWVHFPIDKSHGQWCDHWKQCVWFLPGQGKIVHNNEEVKLRAIHDEISISYTLDARTTDVICDLVLSPERIGLYGDTEWKSVVFKAIQKALSGKIDSLCVVADDSVLLTLALTNLSKTSNTVSLFPGLQLKGLQYLQAVGDTNGLSMDRLQVRKINEVVSVFNDLFPKKVDLLVGEPFYYGSHDSLPWKNLRFWKDRTKLDSVLSEDVLVMPCKGILKACAMSLPDLWNSRRCLDGIEGFDHSVVNATLGACGKSLAPQDIPCLPYYIWQCGEYKILSQELTIMEFDFSKPISSCHGKAQIGFMEPGICHGFALWIDWAMDPQSSMVLSTGPDKKYWKQGVKLLANPVEVGISGSTGYTEHHLYAQMETSFDASNGMLTVEHVFSK